MRLRLLVLVRDVTYNLQRRLETETFKTETGTFLTSRRSWPVFIQEHEWTVEHSKILSNSLLVRWTPTVEYELVIRDLNWRDTDVTRTFQENVSRHRESETCVKEATSLPGGKMSGGYAPHSPGLPGVTRERFKSRNTTAACRGGG